MASGAMSVSLMKPSLSCSFSGPLPAALAKDANKQQKALAKILCLTLTSSRAKSHERSKAISVPAIFLRHFPQAGRCFARGAPKDSVGVHARFQCGAEKGGKRGQIY